MMTPTRIRTRSQHNSGLDGPDAVGQYLEAIAKTPLLAAADEVDLAKRIEAGVFAEQILQGSVTTDVPASVSELKMVIDEGNEAFERFVQANLRLVVSVARKHGRAAMPLLDLVQEGNTGLIRAIKKFDFAAGFKFSTYATWWIRQAITRGIAHGAQIVRLPVHVAEQVNQLIVTRGALTRTLGREPNVRELADALGMDVVTVKSLLRVSLRHVSLDAPLSEDGDTTLADLVVVAPTPGSPQDSEDQLTLQEMLETLDERSADIVRQRYGLGGGSASKLSDIGASWGITAERVRQIERLAIQALRAYVNDPDEVATAC